MPVVNKAFWFFSAVGGLYAVFVGLLTVPSVQRFALYANWVHTAYFDNLHKPETFGFLKNQVTPLSIKTPDNETLFAWHVLPLSVYAANRDELLSQPPGTKFEDSVNLRLAREDASATVIVNFHGNAGHVAQYTRLPHLRSLASLPGHENTHILTIDYRGFGLSSGSPDEGGLTTDALTALAFARDKLGVAAPRTVIIGTSLGTGVTSGALGALARDEAQSVHGVAYKREEAAFGGVLLVAGFEAIPELMRTYAILNLVPVLSPLKMFPWVQAQIEDRILDRWTSAKSLRLAGEMLPAFRLRILHARNDADIPWAHSDALFEGAKAGIEAGEGEKGSGSAHVQRGLLDVREKGVDGSWGRNWVRGDKYVKSRVVEFGGHNRVIEGGEALWEVLKFLEEID